MDNPRYTEMPDSDWDGNLGNIGLADIDIDLDISDHLEIRHDYKDSVPTRTNMYSSSSQLSSNPGSDDTFHIQSQTSFLSDFPENSTFPAATTSFIDPGDDIGLHSNSLQTGSSFQFKSPKSPPQKNLRAKIYQRRRDSNTKRKTSSPSNALHNSLPSNISFPVLMYSKINGVNPDLRTSVSSPGSMTSSSSWTSSSPSDAIPGFPSNLGLNPRSRQLPSPTETSSPRNTPSSMDSIENELFNKVMLRTLNVNSTLLIHTTFALAAYYLRSNCLKNFRKFDGSPKQIETFKKLRTTLIRLSSKYYGLAIHKLRVLISSHEFDVPTAIIVSSLLNKISIYEYSNLNHSITFSRGMVSIFNDVLSNLQSPENNNIYKTRCLQDLAWITNYVIHASKTNNFPPYDPTLLTEYFEVLQEFKSIHAVYTGKTSDDISSHEQRIIFHFNHLHNYTKEIISLLKQRDTKDINEDPSTLYKLLRHWLIILPPKVHVMFHLSSCAVEMTLMNLYKSMSRILENLFPSVFFYFLQGFCGGVSLWTDSSKDVAKSSEYYSKITAIFESRPDLYSGTQIEGLLNMNKYCIRLTSFFQTRSNVLSVCFGDQKQKPEYSPEVIRDNLNEVMIHRFRNTNIRLRNFMHLPQVTKIQKTATTLKNIESYRDKLFFYNKNHVNYFSSQDSTKLASDVIQKAKMDPMLRLHIFNTVNVIDEAPSGSTSSPAYKSKTPIINYSFIFDEAFCKKIVKALGDDYQELFETSAEVPIEETVVFEPHKSGGLFVNDVDPTFMADENDINGVFNRRVHDLVSNQDISRIILKFYDLRNKSVSPASRKMSGIYGGDDDSDDESHNFYDDLNVRYFQH